MNFIPFISFPDCYKWFYGVILFVISLSYFVFGSGWYEPSRLFIQGQCPLGVPTLQVSWDSGAGFNEYEKREFIPQTYPIDKQKTNIIEIGGTGRRNGASQSSDVTCSAIIVDGKKLDFHDLPLGKELRYEGDELLFSQGRTISFPVTASSHIGVIFRTNTQSGIAYVSVNGVESEYDLYMANEAAKFKQLNYWLLLADGSFRIDMDLPHYGIQRMKISAVDREGTSFPLSSVEIHGKGHVIDLLENVSDVAGEISFYNILRSMRSYYQFEQFLQQIVFALLTTWLLISFGRLYQQMGSIRACLFEEKRLVFWMMFISSLFAFSLWLVAFWPGVMSVDSLKVWRAAMLPNEYLNDHPILNVFLYKYFFQLWGDPVIVPVVQIVLMSLLVSWFFFWLYKKGVSLLVIVPCFLLILTSVPIGTFTIVLWKDIPFAMLVVFWGCFLVKLFFQNQNDRLKWTWEKITVLILLGLALALIRHNGIVYLVVLPVMFLLLRLISLKSILLVVLVMGISGYLILFQTKKIQGLDYVLHEVQHYLKKEAVHDIVADSGRVIKDYSSVLNYNSTEQKWDKFHYYLNDRYAYWFLLHSGWWKEYPYEAPRIVFPTLRKVVMKIYDLSYEKPWDMVAWNPVWLLYLLPVVTVLFWWFPHSAILGTLLLAGTLPLVYLRIFNWRYYYFLYFGLLFIIPLMAFDLSDKRKVLDTE